MDSCHTHTVLPRGLLPARLATSCQAGPEHRDRLSPARSASPRRKVARPIAYTSDMGDGVTGAKDRRRDEHEIGDRGPFTFMVVSQDEEQGVCL